MRYFAYGSNMLESRLRHPSRVPSASLLGVGTLRGHRLRFHKRGRDGSGKCNLARTGDPDDLAYGVLWVIADTETPALDRAEDSVRGGYSRRSIEIEISGKRLSAETYFANPAFIDESLRPFHWYKALVVAGSEQHDLPQEYVAAIRDVPASRDLDEGRRQDSLELLDFATRSR